MRIDDWLMLYAPIDGYEFTAATSAILGDHAGFPDIWWWKCEAGLPLHEDCLKWVARSDVTLDGWAYRVLFRAAYCSCCALGNYKELLGEG